MSSNEVKGINWRELKAALESDHSSTAWIVTVCLIVFLEKIVKGESKIAKKIAEQSFFHKETDGDLQNLAGQTFDQYRHRNALANVLSAEQIRTNFSQISFSLDALTKKVIALVETGQFETAILEISRWSSELDDSFNGQEPITISSGNDLVATNISKIFQPYIHRWMSWVYESVVADGKWPVKDPKFYYLQAAIELMNSRIDSLEVLTDDEEQKLHEKILQLLNNGGFFIENLLMSLR